MKKLSIDLLPSLVPGRVRFSWSAVAVMPFGPNRVQPCEGELPSNISQAVKELIDDYRSLERENIELRNKLQEQSQ